MFADALEKVGPYVKPVIISKRTVSGEVHCGVASFIVVNRDGWIITASHVLSDFLAAQQHAAQMAERAKAATQIEHNPHLNYKQKKRQIDRLPRDPNWITNHSYWWGRDGLQVNAWIGHHLADIAVGKLEGGFQGNEISHYPVFRKVSNTLRPGTSLCRLGFPFHQVKATFNETTGQFQIEPGFLPVPFFPMDGMHTRNAVFQDQKGEQAKFIETTTPGLGGQSGGPIFDTSGRVVGLQSKTIHLDLGFNAKVKEGNKEHVERQFLNVGHGLHFEEIQKFLKANNVEFYQEP